MSTKITGNIIATSATQGGTPTARVGLYAGKNADGTYKEGPVVELYGKPLAGLAVGEKVSVTVGAISDRIYTRQDSTNGIGLSAVAMKVEKVNKETKVDPIIIQGNLVADPDEKGGFRIGVHDSDAEAKDVTTFYGVRTVGVDTANLAKGAFVELSGQLTVSLGKDGDRVFRNLTAFSMKKIEKKAEAPNG